MTAGKARSTRTSTILTVLYAVLAVAGLIGTWYWNIRFFIEEPGGNYLASWFANAGSSSAAVDIIVVALAVSVFYVREGAKLGWRWAWVFIPLSFAVAVAFAFPLFLAMREHTISRRNAAAQPAAKG